LTGPRPKRTRRLSPSSPSSFSFPPRLLRPRAFTRYSKTLPCAHTGSSRRVVCVGDTQVVAIVCRPVMPLANSQHLLVLCPVVRRLQHLLRLPAQCPTPRRLSKTSPRPTLPHATNQDPIVTSIMLSPHHVSTLLLRTSVCCPSKCLSHHGAFARSGRYISTRL